VSESIKAAFLETAKVAERENDGLRALIEANNKVIPGLLVTLTDIIKDSIEAVKQSGASIVP
jgi:hypothetical protein